MMRAWYATAESLGLDGGEGGCKIVDHASSGIFDTSDM